MSAHGQADGGDLVARRGGRDRRAHPPGGTRPERGAVSGRRGCRWGHGRRGPTRREFQSHLVGIVDVVTDGRQTPPRSDPRRSRPQSNHRQADDGDLTAARADELRQLVEYHTRRYFVDDDPEITDAEFDALVAELAAIEAERPDLAQPDSPLQPSGGWLPRCSPRCGIARR